MFEVESIAIIVDVNSFEDFVTLCEVVSEIELVWSDVYHSDDIDNVHDNTSDTHSKELFEIVFST